MKPKGVGAGLLLANEWSSNGSNYKGFHDVEYRWNKFKLSHRRPVRMGTLVMLAKKYSQGQLPLTIDASGLATWGRPRKWSFRGPTGWRSAVALIRGVASAPTSSPTYLRRTAFVPAIYTSTGCPTPLSIHIPLKTKGVSIYVY